MQGTTETAELTRERSTFAFTAGGPFYRVMTRLRLRTPTSMARCWWLGLLVWLPLAIDAAVHHLLGEPVARSVFDLSLHARLLFALPVLLVSERVFDRSVKSAMRSMYDGKFCATASIDAVVDRAARMRDSKQVELALLLLAILGGQLVLWRVVGPTGLFHGGDEHQLGLWSFSRVWYAVVALPLVQFVMLRWMWRWLIWGYMLARFSRLPLFVLATHADYAGGLSALARPVSAFCAFVLGNSAILAAAWGTQVLEDRTTIKALVPLLVGYETIALVIAVGPLLMFSAHLFRARRRTLAQYSDFMRTYTLNFHAKWVENPTTPIERALGTPDIQSLCDLGESFQVVAKTRPVVFGPRVVFSVWLAGILPMLPLFAHTVTVEHVFKRIVSTVLGGFPL